MAPQRGKRRRVDRESVVETAGALQDEAPLGERPRAVQAPHGRDRRLRVTQRRAGPALRQQHEGPAHPGLRGDLGQAGRGRDADGRVQRGQRAAEVTELACRQAKRAVRRRLRAPVTVAPREFNRPRGLGGRAGGVGGHQVKRRPRRLGGGPRLDPGVLLHGGSPFCS